MAEELKQEFEGDRTKGFISLTQPFIYYKDEQEDDVKHILTEENYDNYCESLDDRGFNEKNVPYYYLTFYEIQDQESPCSFFPEEVRSSSQNEIGPLEWNAFSSTCRISKSRFLITGGVNLQQNYNEIFQKKFELVLIRHKLVKEFKEYIDALQVKNEAESENDQRIRIMPIVQKVSQIKQDQINWKSESDLQKQKELIAEVLQNEINKIKLKCEREFSKLDKDYCKANDIEYKFKEDLPPQALIFNLDTPYSRSAIEVVLNFIPHEDKYEFTARYVDAMPACVSHHQSVFHKGKVYVLGGVCKQVIQKSVYVYDILTQSWSQFTDMNLPRINFSAVSHGDYIYVLGGHTANFSEDSYDFNNLERINPSDNSESWQTLTQKKKMGYSHSQDHQLKLISYKNQLILLGGGSTKKDVDNPKENTQLSKIELVADGKWQVSPIPSNISVRKGEIVAVSTFRGEECFYVYGGNQKLQLECFKLLVNENTVTFEKIFDNDYAEEVNSYDSDHIICQPNIFIE